VFTPISRGDTAVWGRNVVVDVNPRLGLCWLYKSYVLSKIEALAWAFCLKAFELVESLKNFDVKNLVELTCYASRTAQEPGVVAKVVEVPCANAGPVMTKHRFEAK